MYIVKSSLSLMYQGLEWFLMRQNVLLIICCIGEDCKYFFITEHEKSTRILSTLMLCRIYNPDIISKTSSGI